MRSALLMNSTTALQELTVLAPKKYSSDCGWNSRSCLLSGLDRLRVLAAEIDDDEQPVDLLGDQLLLRVDDVLAAPVADSRRRARWWRPCRSPG